jgi:hypothetical protein
MSIANGTCADSAFPAAAVLETMCWCYDAAVRPAYDADWACCRCTETYRDTSPGATEVTLALTVVHAVVVLALFVLGVTLRENAAPTTVITSTALATLFSSLRLVATVDPGGRLGIMQASVAEALSFLSSAVLAILPLSQFAHFVESMALSRIVTPLHAYRFRTRMRQLSAVLFTLLTIVFLIATIIYHSGSMDASSSSSSSSSSLAEEGKRQKASLFIGLGGVVFPVLVSCCLLAQSFHACSTSRNILEQISEMKKSRARSKRSASNSADRGFESSWSNIRTVGKYEARQTRYLRRLGGELFLITGAIVFSAWARLSHTTNLWLLAHALADGFCAIFIVDSTLVLFGGWIFELPAPRIGMLRPCWCCCTDLFMDREQRARQQKNSGKGVARDKMKTKGAEQAQGSHDNFVYTLSEYSTSEDEEEHDDSYFIPKQTLVVELSAGGESSSKLSNRMSIHISG